MRGDIHSDELMKNMQDESLAMNGNLLSTVIHELGHWYQYQQIKANHPELSHSEIIGKERKKSRKMFAAFDKAGYDISEDISEYALKSLANEKEYGTFSEMFVLDLLGGVDYKKF